MAHVAVREGLPARRASLTFRFEHAFDRGSQPFRYQATIGFFPDGRIGEVFLNTEKVSTGMDAYARDAAIAVSIAVQYGAPLSVLCNAMTRNPDGAPSSPIGALLDRLAPQEDPTEEDNNHGS